MKRTVRRWLAVVGLVGLLVSVGMSARPAQAVSIDQLCDPTSEDCRQPIWDYINHETQEIDMSLWYISDASIVNMLINRFNAGVKVRILVDPKANPSKSSNAQYLAQLAAAGIPMRYNATPYDSVGIQHAKFLVFAAQNVVQAGTGNYSPYSLVTPTPHTDYTLNAIYFTNDPALVSSYETHFDDLWLDTTNYADYANITSLVRSYPVVPISTDLNFPPGTGPQFDSFSQRVISLINAETQQIDVLPYRLTDVRYGDALLAALGRGVVVRIMVEPDEYRNPDQWRDAYNIDRLYAAGALIKKRLHQGQTHQKSAVFYSQNVVVFGSSNWTQNSSDAQVEDDYFTVKPAMVTWFKNQFATHWAATSEYGAFTPLASDVAPAQSFPANGATNLAASFDLAWDGGFWLHKYDLYFGTSATPPLFASNVSSGSPDPGVVETYHLANLTPGTRYYWKLVGKTMAGVTSTSPTWSFTVGTPGVGPVVNTVFPQTGTAKGGTTITIAGGNFAPGAVVYIGGVPATNVAVLSAASITAVTPAHLAGTVPIMVVSADGQSSVLNSSYTYIEYPLVPGPSIASVNPASGTAGDTVTINGTGFGKGTSVSFGGISATVLSTSYTALRVTAPAHTAGSVDVQVNTPYGLSTTSPNAFTYTGTPPVNQPPQVTVSANPTNGTAPLAVTFTTTANDPDGTIASYGWNFGDGQTATVASPSHTYQNPGAYTATVTVTDNQGATASASVTTNVSAPVVVPTISNISPSSGFTNGGVQAIVTGTNFVGGATVTIGATAASGVSVVNSTTITLTVPAHNAGSMDVTVTNPSGQSATLVNGFTYIIPANQPPQVTATATPTTGTSPLSVNFATTASDSDGSIASYGWSFGDGQTAATANPSHTYVAAGSYTARVTVTDNQGATAQQSIVITVTTPQPTVASVTPNSGPTSGGANVTISGTNFLPGATVTVGGTAATAVTVVNSSTITATTPAHAAGQVTLVVTNPDSQTATLAQAYTYVAPNQPPQVTVSANPANGTAPLAVTFATTASDPDGSIASYSWTFGDGQTASTANPSHTYSNPGTYTATVTVTDNQGATASASVTVTVTSVPLPPAEVVLLSDDFTGSLDLTKWVSPASSNNLFSGYTDTAVAVTSGGSQLIIGPLKPGLSGSHYNGIRSSKTNYNFTNSYAQVQVVQTPNRATASDMMLTLGQSVTGYYRIYVEGQTLTIQKNTGSKITMKTLTFDPVNHAFWRIRHEAATNRVVFETAPAISGVPGTWTTQYAEAWNTSAMPLSNVMFELKAGTWQPETNPGSAVFAHLKVAHP